jgi:hypothetical protein
MTPEPFVSAEEAVKFVPVTRRHLLTLARRGIAGAYPVDARAKRKIWVFRLSEITAAIAEKSRPENGNVGYDPIQPSVLATERSR